MTAPPHEPAEVEQELSLAELVNRVLDRGVVVKGDVMISVAGVELVYLRLQLLLSSMETLLDAQEGANGHG